jgi:hypothetical protein
MKADLVALFMERKPILEAIFAQEHPESYKHLVTTVVRVLNPEQEYGGLDYNRIHEINDGDYQGCLLYIIAAVGYQPRDYWVVRVAYGSCSGCDTLQAIRMYDDNPPRPAQIEDYMTLALHIVQSIKDIQGDCV